MKKHHATASLTIFLTIAGIIFLIIFLPPNQAEITKFTLAHPFLAPLIIILWRIIGVVIPPIPGGILSFALIPALGWFPSFVYGMTGVLIGATIAFFIARKYREPAVTRFVPLQKLRIWENKLTQKTEFFAFLGIRFTTGPIMDFVSYIAGLSKISYKKFILATIISLLPDALLYRLGEASYKQFAEKSAYLAAGFVILLGVALYFIKDKITEKKL